MIAAILTIEVVPNGIAINQVTLTNPSDECPTERTIASVCDIALKIAGEFVASMAKSGTMIEGKHIEEHVSKMLKQNHAYNIREELKKHGWEIPQ